ncbi:MAG: hypothetical protein VX762_00270 [Bacteroidota bacterium]|nr:hypothetical protein [Bacteroidota bacterium]MEC9208845.1 hypothetical protein [Bacteroidota bacterium]
MRDIYKISAIVLLSITMVISSCKKEDNIIEGCTDIAALNYLVDATSNNGSCIYAYDIAQGQWNITPDCEEYDVLDLGLYIINLNDELPATIDVQGAGDNSLYIEIDETQVNGTVDNSGNIIVPSQTISLDMGFGPIDIDIEGDGLINTSNTGIINLIYSFDNIQIPNLPIPLPVPISDEIDCAISLNR